MLNEPQVQHLPPDQQPDVPSLAEMLAARPKLQTTEGALPFGAAPRPVGDESMSPQKPGRGLLASVPLHSDALGENPDPLPFDTPVRSGRPLPEEGDLAEPLHQIPLLLVHAGQSDGALVQSWMRNVMKGSGLHTAHFQEAVAELVQEHQPQAVLIQFDPHCVDNAVALATELKAHHPRIPRLAIGRTRDVSCMLAALRAGVQDFLDIDSPIEVAQRAILAITDQPTMVAPDAPQTPVTAIISARAGLGCSLLATHLSWYLQSRLLRTTLAHARSGEPTLAGGVSGTEALTSLLVELGTPSGDCAIYLNTPGEFSFHDAVAHQLRLDRRMAQTALARHESGLRLLSQARHPHTASSAEVVALLKRLGQYFRHIVLDLGAMESAPIAEGVLSQASEIWVVCDQSVASVVWTTELLQQMEQLQIARDRVQLIVNRHDARLELTAQQIERQLNVPLLAVIPERRKELSEVVNQGRLFAPASRREPYAHAIEKLATQLLSGHHPEVATTEPSSSRSLLSPIARLLQGIRRN